MSEYSFESNFQFLEAEYPMLANIATSAEFNCFTDPVVTLIKLRQFGEFLVDALFVEHGMEVPTEASFHKRLKQLEFENVLPERVKDLLFAIKSKGNIATHQAKGEVEDAKAMLFFAFKIAKWFCETYSVKTSNLNQLKFSTPKEEDSRHALNLLENKYQDLKKELENLQKKYVAQGLSTEKKESIKQRSEKAARNIDMSEGETRQIIDAQLRNAGWEADTTLLNFKTNKTLPQRGKNIAIAEWPVDNRWADYALFIGTELYAIVEAKKYASDISTDLRQSKIYAELAKEKNEAKLLGEWESYKVPFLFSTNGRPYLKQIETKSGIWFLDIRGKRNAAKALQGWYSPEGLKKLFEQNTDEAIDKLKNTNLTFLQDKSSLGLRDYQIKAIDAVEKQLINEPEKNRALLAMATGTGKTRTILGLCYRLIQSNRFKRILFLVDRTLLGTQAADAFKDNKIVGLNTFAETYEIKGLKDVLPDVDTRVHFATVQGMVKRLFYTEEGAEVPPIDQYDCIIIDEAHRGYLQDRELDEEELNFKDQRDYVSKYRMVLDYFDAFAVALTATPALHTQEIFGHPVFTYSYREAVIDGYLIDHEPPYQIKTKLSENGIVWKQGEKPKAFDKETNTIIELDKLEDELAIEVSGFNKLVITEAFNREVVKYLVDEIDPEGEEKTLIFCATDEHADLVVHLLKEQFREIGVDLPDDAIQKMTGKVKDVDQLVKKYKNESLPNIGVTVDLLTTGIDVPKICNLIFLRRVKSRILYEQMLGRATRKCDEIRKEVFRIYDAVKIYEALQDFTQMSPVVSNPKTTFKQLVGEFEQIESEERTKQQIEQIIAKLQRKRNLINGTNEEQFSRHTSGTTVDGFISQLQGATNSEAINTINNSSGLWHFLDELKPTPRTQLYSEHEDEFLGIERGYGQASEPQDYLSSFEIFIRENVNKIAALSIVVNRPKELTREALKELKLILDEQGYNRIKLREAWKASKNEDIAADIISYIRTAALGTTLESHEQRIRLAMEKIKAMHSWNAIQKKWLDRFEKQLLAETILQPQDLDSGIFKENGGYLRLNKIFNEQLDGIIETINENLYIGTA